MVSENEENTKAIFDLSDAASNVSYGIQNLLKQKFESTEEETEEEYDPWKKRESPIEKEFYAISDTLWNINNFIKKSVEKNELYKKLKKADESIDPCFGAGFYLNQLKFDVEHANKLWDSNGPWALAENAWSVSPFEMEKVLSKIKKEFDIFSSYAKKCAAKL